MAGQRTLKGATEWVRLRAELLACSFGLNSAILSFMDRLGIRNVPRQARFFDAHVEQAVQALLTGSCSVY